MMGKKFENPSASYANNGTGNGIEKSRKRKKNFSQQPSAKRSKNDKHSDEDEKDYQERFKFVLAPKSQQQNHSEDPEVELEQQQQQPKMKKFKVVKKKQHGKELTDIYNEEIETSSDDSWLDEEFESLSEEEECEDEWETDTDYEMCDDEYLFNSSDGEEVTSNGEDYQECSDDSDYVPPIEDKYIKKGDAVLYDAKGLDIAFGESNESQIIDVNEMEVEMDDDPEEIPKLLTANGEDVEMTTSEELPKNGPKTSSKPLNDEEEELGFEFSLLPQHITFYDCIADQGVIIKLNKTIHFMGILDIRPLVNAVQVNGYKIATGESITATSISHADYYLNLTPVINENCQFDEKKLIEELKNLLPPSQDIQALLEGFNVQKDVLIYLQRGPSSAAVEILKTYCPYSVLPHKNILLKNSPSPSSELILYTKFFVSEENPRFNCYRINEDWKYIDMKKDSKTVIVGGKNVGKSALTQYMINSNIDKFGKILLIDLDIGQPICGAAQTVSATLVTKPLIGAGYLSNLETQKCFLYGDKSITISPFKYIECVRRLVTYCNAKDELKNVPWIINTMGYQKGFGFQLITLLIRIIQPTDVVQVQHKNAKYNFQNVINEQVVNNYTFSFFNDRHLSGISKEAFFTTHVLDSLVNNNDSQHQNQENRDNGGNEWISNATEKRKMSLLAQLSKLMRGGQTYLNEVLPHCTPLNRIRTVVIDEEFENAAHYGEVNPDLFNGNLVYLCHASDYDDNDDDVNSVPLDSNSILECHGVGLVRAIDKIHRLMYVLMPQHEDKLRSVINVIAIGNIPLPSEILLKQNFGIEGKIPHVTFFKDRNMKKYINKRNIKDCF